MDGRLENKAPHEAMLPHAALSTLHQHSELTALAGTGTGKKSQFRDCKLVETRCRHICVFQQLAMTLGHPENLGSLHILLTNPEGTSAECDCILVAVATDTAHLRQSIHAKRAFFSASPLQSRTSPPRTPVSHAFSSVS